MEWIKSTYINGIPTIIIRQLCVLQQSTQTIKVYRLWQSCIVYVFDVNNYGFEFLHDKMKISLHDMVL